MADVSRRQALAIVSGALASPLLPAAAPAPPLAAPVPLYPVWEVGIEGYPNWRMIAAKTAERALQIFREDIGLCEDCDGLRCAQLDPDGECEHAGLDARALSERIVPPQAAEGDIAAGLEEMHAAGWKHECSRCYFDDPETWHIVADKAVCDDCLTPQERDAIDHDDFLHWFLNDRYDVKDASILLLLRPEDFADDVIAEALAEFAALYPECIHLAPFARSLEGATG